MAWDKTKLELSTMLSEDIADWGKLHPSTQSAIIEWIFEDRKQFHKQLRSQLVKLREKALSFIDGTAYLLHSIRAGNYGVFTIDSNCVKALKKVYDATGKEK